MPRLDGVVQGTDHWKHLRIGKITASKVAGLIGLSNYDSATEVGKKLRLVNDPGIPDNKYMAHGRHYEDEARDAYSAHTGHIVEEGGFYLHDNYHFAAASPDGIIDLGDGKKFGIEIKCPYSQPYGCVPVMYWAQCQHQIACCNLEYVDFFVYWVLKDDDDAYKPKSHYQCFRVRPSEWWDRVVGPEILRRYTHCVIERKDLPRMANRSEVAPVWPRLKEYAVIEAHATSEELFCSL
jgi:putative phage-type endonuclease